ncbi:flavin reductase family protein [Streptomyces rishiriensis]|uniref:Flavin reductase (DIM6/NTAB) family NADH-FMN oxidoreductase RutF n=1 Tax=Streptomyces rishiriensis TaxID=68264 RepID=A0ABU0P2A1_STRRH|nr:flavin reductase family protein [Streptomyces rishiriensis]MDQ0585528.1 flavin reductase (DIM6/NTAB) family NADH-FMN oxidoreductase RutF [Streptomyces rishiriensis]
MTDMDAFTDRLDPDMCVVTAEAGGERAGCLVGFASQCSMRPVRFVVWLSKVNRTFEVARAAEFLAVHLLTPEQFEVAALFGGETGDRVDKFERTRWTQGHGGALVLEDAYAWFVGRIEQRIDAGDHVGFVLDPVRSGARGRPDGRPLLRLADALAIEPGHPVD